MAGTFPTSQPNYTNPAPTDSTATEVGTRTHSEFHGDVNDDVEGLATKLGTGASTPSANTVLRGTGPGTTAYGQIVSGDITDGTIVNADLNASAAVVVSKLSAGGTANRVVLTTDGTTMTLGQIVAAQITNDTITATQLAADAVGASELADNSVASANIIDDSIVNADINSAAAIAVTKIAHVGSGNVLRSNGTTNAAGQVQAGDIATGAVTDVKLATPKVNKNFGYTTFAGAVAELGGVLGNINENPVSDSPTGVGNDWLVMQAMVAHATNYGWQLGGSLLDVNSIYTRMILNGVGGTWYKLWHDGNTAGKIRQVQYVAGSTSNPTTTSTSFVDATDMSITLTTGACSLLVLFYTSTYNSSVGAENRFGAKVDAGTTITRVEMQQQANANIVGNAAFFQVLTGISAASHTVKVQWSVSSGTGTLNSDWRAMVVMEVAT